MGNKQSPKEESSVQTRLNELRELGNEIPQGPPMSRVKRTQDVPSKRTYNDPMGIADGPKQPD